MYQDVGEAHEDETGDPVSWPAGRYGERTAIVFGDARLTFFRDGCPGQPPQPRAAFCGLTPGHKVAALLSNGVESATSILAIPRAGLTYVALNARHSTREHAEILNDSETDAVIVGRELLDLLDPVSRRSPP